MRFRRCLFVITVAVLSPSCAPPAAENAEDDSQGVTAEASSAEAEAALRATVEEMLAAYNNEDVAVLEGMYAQDIVILPPQAAVIDGYAAAIQNLATLPESDYVIDAQVRDLQVSGNLGVTFVSYSDVSTPRDGGEATTSSGRWALVWVRGANGSWQISREIWNLEPEETDGS